MITAAPVLAAGGGTDQLGLQLLIAAGVLAVVAVGWWLMRRSWLRRAGRQDDMPELPPEPAEVGALYGAPLKGMYLGTVEAGSWLDRIAAQGLGARADGWLQITEEGVRLERAGCDPVWIPRDALRGARLDRAHAGKVIGPGRIVVIVWAWGGQQLETGFRGVDRSRQPKIVRRVHAILGPGLDDAPTPEEPADPRLFVDTQPHPMPEPARPFAGGLRRLRRPHADGEPAEPPPGGSAPLPGRGLYEPEQGPERDPADVDPLTSPIGEVVRAMKEQP